MIATDRNTGRRYQLVKVFAANDVQARYLEARTGRRYNLVKRYI